MLERYSLQDQAYNYLRNIILNEELPHGEIFSEQSFADKLGTSRTPIREAVIRLCYEGLVEMVPSRGFTIKALQEREVKETYQIRIAIEGYCAMLIAKDIKTPEAQKVLSIINSLLDTHRSFSQHDPSITLENILAANKAIHTQIVNYSNNEFFINTFNNLYSKYQVLSRNNYAIPGRLDKAYEEHKNLYEAIASGDPASAMQETIKHLEVAIDSHLAYFKK